MNILYLCHRIPFPPTKGDKIRSFHQIQYLSRNHRLHLACLIGEEEDLQHVEALKQYCVSVEAVFRGKIVAQVLGILGLITNQPLSVRSFYSKQLQRKISTRLNSEKFDVIFVFSSTMAEYVRRIHHIPKVIDFVDVDSDKWRTYANFHSFPLSWLYKTEWKRMARYEAQIAGMFARSIFVSDNEANLFQKQVTGEAISMIPNGVDHEYFDPNQYDDGDSTVPTIVFTGAMDYFPNIDGVRYFCSEIFPRVRRALPEAAFYIVGRNPTRQVRELGALPGVSVTGTVADVRPYLSKATVAVAPLRIARGLQNKILEAMAMGIPVVGTSNAFQGVRATQFDGVRIGDTPDDFAMEVIKICADPHVQKQCSLQAREYIRRHHHWDDHGIALEALLAETVGTRLLDRNPVTVP